jgi:hypothetical protein
LASAAEGDPRRRLVTVTGIAAAVPLLSGGAYLAIRAARPAPARQAVRLSLEVPRPLAWADSPVVSPDGSPFLMDVAVKGEALPPINVVLDWPAHLQRK